MADAVFRDRVIARIVEPTSKLNSLRVLADLGADLLSYKTIDRHIRKIQADGCRDVIAAKCLAYVPDCGGLSLLLYDVTTLFFEAARRRTSKPLMSWDCHSSWAHARRKRPEIWSPISIGTATFHRRADQRYRHTPARQNESQQSALRAEPVWNPEDHPGAWRAIWSYSAKRARRDQTLAAQELSPARLMGPPLCHEYGTGLCPVAGRVVMVTEDGPRVNPARPDWRALVSAAVCRTRPRRRVRRRLIAVGPLPTGPAAGRPSWSGSPVVRGCW